MKKSILKYLFITAWILVFAACSPDKLTYNDPDIIDEATLDSIGLLASHTMIVADGKATLEFTPVAYTKERFKIYGPRMKDEWFTYTTDVAGVKIDRFFTVSDPSLIGKEIKVTLSLKSRPEVKSKEVTFKIIAPLAVNKSYTMPIIIHIIQTNEDVDSYGGIYGKDRIDQFVDRLNLVFAGDVSVHPAGINTKINFKQAMYNPQGGKMNEVGINRLTVKEITFDDAVTKRGYFTFLKDNNLIWDPTKYMNIWLISDRANNGKVFSWRYSYPCMPKYQTVGATNAPEGLVMRENPSADSLQSPLAAGLMYRLQAINQIRRYTGSSYSPEDNDLIHYIGCYLGLLRSAWFTTTGFEDYCDDTQAYYYVRDGLNNSLYKEGLNNLFFLGENIMDDPTGVHKSVTQQQYLRMQWVLENCIDRAAWRSDFAFTGK